MLNPRVFIVDDHKAILRTLECALPQLLPCTIVGTAVHATIALKLIPQLKPDVLWVDVCLPEIDGPNLLRLLKAREILPGRVLFTGTEGSALIRDAMSVDPEGFVSKLDDIDCWRQALEAASTGGTYFSPSITAAKKRDPDAALLLLTDMERVVFSLVLQNMKNEEVAEKLGISRHTARHHREHMMRKVGAHSIMDLCKVAMQAGMLDIHKL